jgi:ketosteroid isomerase-like protein
VSQENVDVVAAYFEQIVRNVHAHQDEPRSYAADLESGEPDADSRKVLDLMHPDIRWINALGDVAVGKLACAKHADELLGAMARYSITLEDVVDLDPTHVLAVTQIAMTGRVSGVSEGGLLFQLLTVRDGLITEHVEYMSRADALEAVGIEE